MGTLRIYFIFFHAENVDAAALPLSTRSAVSFLQLCAQNVLVASLQPFSDQKPVRDRPLLLLACLFCLSASRTVASPPLILLLNHDINIFEECKQGGF